MPLPSTTPSGEATSRRSEPTPPCASATVEAEWIRRLRCGDAEALEAIFHTYYAPLCAFAEGWTGSSELAEDAVCDVFCHLWERRETGEIRNSLKGYLYRAVRNRIRQHFRHQRVVDRLLRPAVPQICPGMGEACAAPDEYLEAARLAVALEATLNELPARAREAFILQRSHALTYAEIAEAMGITVSTVEKHMIRAFKLLRRRLADWS